MALVSMKRTAKEKKEETDVMNSPKEDDFPFGLSLRLEDEELTKLGMSESPDVGVEMMLTAKVKVNHTSESKRDGSDEERSISLQVTDMELKPATDKKSTADVLFGDK